MNLTYLSIQTFNRELVLSFFYSRPENRRLITAYMDHKFNTVFFSFLRISIESMQQTGKHFFTLAAYKLHALCVNKNFPVKPLPLINLPFGLEESFPAGRHLSRTYEHFHPENILPIPRQLTCYPNIDVY